MRIWHPFENLSLKERIIIALKIPSNANLSIHFNQCILSFMIKYYISEFYAILFSLTFYTRRI